MSSSAPPISPAAPQLPLRPLPSEDSASPLAKAADQRITQFEAAMRESVMPANLNIRYDESAERFVATLTDANTQETLRKYPSDFQLASSRAIMAYLRAHAESVNKT